MAKRKRNIQILFCVSPEEKKLIRRKMIESKTKNMGAYLRKMAIDGYIVNTDTIILYVDNKSTCFAPHVLHFIFYNSSLKFSRYSSTISVLTRTTLFT